jgi:hypothetical protein
VKAGLVKVCTRKTDGAIQPEAQKPEIKRSLPTS